MAPSAAPLPTPSLARGLLGGFCAVLLLGLAMAWLWGFTVDDALITARVAWHLARGTGYRFNASGPLVDAVTPLGFAYVLAPFAKPGPLQALACSKALGAGSVLLAVFFLGRRVVQRTSVAYAGALLVCLAATAPLAAWAVSGMETGLVTALCVAALSGGSFGLGADLAAALAAAWRPELTPWCCSVRLLLRLQAPGMTLGRALGSPALVVAAVALVGAVRGLVFGRVAPLAVFAKPSDLEHGLRYAVFGFVQTGLPLLCLAPLTLRRGAPLARVLVLSGVVHFLALLAAGGDWMSLYRLWVPVLPSFVLAGAELWRVAPAWASWARVAAAGAMSVYLALLLGPSARGVGPAREQLIEQAKRLFDSKLSGRQVVATLDVGWVGAAGDFTVVDLAGVTDERVAMLPGGHTSKRIDAALLRSRRVDTLILLEALPPGTGYAREVERRVAALPAAEDFAPIGTLPLGNGSGQRYAVLAEPNP